MHGIFTEIKIKKKSIVWNLHIGGWNQLKGLVANHGFFFTKKDLVSE